MHLLKSSSLSFCKGREKSREELFFYNDYVTFILCMFTDACTTYSDYFLYSAMKKVYSIFFIALRDRKVSDTQMCYCDTGCGPKEHTSGS